MSTWERLIRTKIYQSLTRRAKESEFDKDITFLVMTVGNIVKDSDVLLSKVSESFPEYTLHDATHSVKVIELMDRIIPLETLRSLNCLELSILILSAYLHDIGMIRSKTEVNSLLLSNDFAKFRENNWVIYDRIKDAIAIGEHRTATELEDSLLTEYIRTQHCKRAYDYIKTKMKDNRLQYHGTSFVDDLAQICASHCLDASDLLATKKNELGNFVDVFRRDKSIGDLEINAQYLAVCLRLADILDFDRERTPKILMEYISPKNKVSISEWMKHLSITGWKISKNEIRYEAECIHPVYQYALYKFLDQIDMELERCSHILRDNRGEIAKKYRIDIPIKVNRDYIVSKGFYYGPFQFSLDYEKILSLLMGEKLYHQKSVAIRELLQNAIDACRHRQAREQLLNKIGYNPQITFVHIQRETDNLLEIDDNGIGMDMGVLVNHFMKIGVSYYRSREFEIERIAYRKKGFDFDPISRFGIGILSSFMIADRLEVETYKANPTEIEKARPLRVEIEGPSHFFVIRPGSREQQGTKIRLFLKKNFRLDLPEILKEYAVHVEFPIICKTERSSQIIEDKGFVVQPIISKLSSRVISIPICLSKNRFFLGIKGRLNLFFLNDNGSPSFKTNDLEISRQKFIDLKRQRKFALELASSLLEESQSARITQYLSKHKEMNSDGLIGYIEKEFYQPANLRTKTRKNLPEFLDFHTISEKFHDEGIIGFFSGGRFASDGISTKLPDSRWGLDLPHHFDINVIGSDKPNLTIDRAAVVDDDAFREFHHKMKIIIADRVCKQILSNKSMSREKKFYFFKSLCENDVDVFQAIVSKASFKRSFPIRLLHNGQTIYLTLPELFEKFCGKIYIRNHDDESEVVDKHFKDKALVDGVGWDLPKLIAKSSSLKLATIKETHYSYIESSLFRDWNSRFDADPFIFAEYTGECSSKLYYDNRVNAFNQNHVFSKIYLKHKASGDQESKMISDRFEHALYNILDFANNPRAFTLDLRYINELMQETRHEKSNNRSISVLTMKDFYFGKR